MVKAVINEAVVAAVAGVAIIFAAQGIAGADPDPAPAPPPLPNVNAYTPISPVDYTVNNGQWYAFAGPAGVICILNRANGDYGCSGPLPGAPEGANLVSAGAVGAPTFSTTPTPLFGAVGSAKSLPPNTRLSFREVSCGVDGAGVVACVNSRDQVGFVVGPTVSFVNGDMPLLDRPDGTNPYSTGLPGR
ncbi:MAG: hypothetical protein ACOYBX_10015 [Mycobacterium sp.]|jgi:hypothetical protein